MITEENSKHTLTSNEKIKYWGYGEWVEEPDELTFTHNEIECKVLRITAFEKSGNLFGGHLCGYVKVPKNHPLYGKHYDDFSMDVHHGLTFGEFDENGCFWIGFDCAHHGDIVPSTEHLYKIDPSFIEIRQRYPQTFRSESYKNMNFCMEECKNMADQLKGQL